MVRAGWQHVHVYVYMHVYVYVHVHMRTACRVGSPRVGRRVDPCRRVAAYSQGCRHTRSLGRRRRLLAAGLTATPASLGAFPATLAALGIALAKESLEWENSLNVRRSLLFYSIQLPQLTILFLNSSGSPTIQAILLFLNI